MKEFSGKLFIENREFQGIKSNLGFFQQNGVPYVFWEVGEDDVSVNCVCEKKIEVYWKVAKIMGIKNCIWHIQMC